MKKKNDKSIIGKVFGRLTVVEKIDKLKVKCKCSCGKEVSVYISNLRNGLSTSCRCYRAEKVKEVQTTHGFSNTKLYKIWYGIKSRCYHSYCHGYENYGGKGITMCEEWLNDFEKFKKWSLENGYREDLSIDRINISGNYEPSNCRWVTLEEQANNKRNTKLLEYEGDKKSVAQWSRKFGININTLHTRLNKGWDIEKALSTPVRKKRRLP